MPKSVIEYKCLLISPRDVEDERKALTELVTRWNAQIGNALDTRIDLVRWESHATPEMGGDEVQSILNDQIVDNCDFGVAIFWSRIGTPTKEFASGSVEELRQLIARGARVLVYFSRKPIPQELLDIEQFKKLEEFKKEIQKEGLLGEYSDIHNLKEQVLLHLTSVLVDLLSKDRPGIGQIGKPTPFSMQKPDIKIKTTPGFVSTGAGTRDVLIIEVQNHSPMVVFTGMVSIQLKNQHKLVFTQDSMGEHQRRRELRPGEKFAFYLFPEMIFDKVSPDDISHIVVTDDIDRTYESDPAQLNWIVQELWKKYKERHV